MLYLPIAADIHVDRDNDWCAAYFLTIVFVFYFCLFHNLVKLLTNITQPLLADRTARLLQSV